MRRPVPCMLSLAVSASLWAASAQASTSDPPVPAPPAPAAAPGVVGPALLAIERDLVDLGEVPRGAKAEASFVLRNTGTRPVKILSARPG